MESSEHLDYLLDGSGSRALVATKPAPQTPWPIAVSLEATCIIAWIAVKKSGPRFNAVIAAGKRLPREETAYQNFPELACNGSAIVVILPG